MKATKPPITNSADFIRRRRLVPWAGGDVEDHSAYEATDGEAGCGGATEEGCAETDRNGQGDPVFAGWSHQASAIHLQAATVSGVQTAATTAITSIGLFLSAFTVASEAPSPHHSIEGYLRSDRPQLRDA